MRKPGTKAADNGLQHASSQSFLTDEQRAALDQALAKKRAEQREHPEAPKPAVL